MAEIINDLKIPLTIFPHDQAKLHSPNFKFPLKTEFHSKVPFCRTILSRLFFTWTQMAMTISNKTSLKASHITSSHKINITRSDLEYLKGIWFGGYSSLRYFPLLLAIMRANYISLTLLFIVTFIATALKFVQIYFLRQLILVFKWLQDPSLNPPLFSLYPSVCLFLTAKVVYILTQYQIRYLENMIGRKTANQISSIVYEKTMKTFSLSKSKFSEGEVLNYIQVDVETLGNFFYYLPKTVVVPFQFSMYIVMLFNIFGSSFVFGFGTFVALMLISYFIQMKYMRNQKKYLRDKDNRMKLTSETFHMLKVLKLFAWDEAFGNRIHARRLKELKSMRKILNLEVLSGFIHWAMPLLLSVVSVGVFTYTNGVMDIANLFTSIDIIDTMSGPLYRLPTFITSLLNALVSMGRISKFLNETDTKVNHKANPLMKEVSISIVNCSFGEKNTILQTNDKILLTNINLHISKGEFIAVLGETGSGKSCLIHSLLSDIDMIPRENDHSFIVNGAFSYAAQSPWIMNETIMKNILFFKEMNREKYARVLQICQLEKDLEELPGRDITEIGANGTNISGGQKARISLARAVYSDSDIYLFDDPISSCDSYVSLKIFNEVFMKYLHGKTRIVVTNDIRGLDKVDRIIYIEKGAISWIGSYEDIQKKQFYIDMQHEKEHQESNTFREVIETEDTVTESQSYNTTSSSNDDLTAYSKKELEEKAKLTKEEDQVQGKVGLVIYHRFVQLIGGYLFLGILIGISIAWQLAKVRSNVWLTEWTNDDSDNLYSFLIYSQISLISVFCLFLKDFIISRGTLNINTELHDSMLTRLMNAPMNLFHDTIPIGQILNRLSSDLEQCKPIIKICSSFLKSNCTLIGAIVVCCQYNKYCLILSPMLISCGLGVSYYYLNAGRDLNRLEGISRSPILSLYSETIIGMSTIKAFKVERHFKDLFFDRLDDYYSIVNYKFGAASWFSLYLELLSVLYIFFILIFSVIYKEDFTAAAIGLLIKYSVSFSEEMLGVLDCVVDIERSLVSIERCETFTKVIQEKAAVVNEDSKLKSWPGEGKIEFKSYSTRYRPNIDLVLKNISITIHPREKVGVVGRTGSGKSTLALTLFRLLEAESGSIFIDNINIATVGTRKLRQSITIVPQDPTLYEGTLKSNLDPLNTSNKNELILAIEKVNLFTLMRENGRDISLGLNMPIKGNGSNLSLGEKQLICFARALLRKTSIILFDEATASVDQKTEKLIQRTIDAIFVDSTMITIAHRVQTVIKCDKILVMDNGRVAEFDTPANLLNVPNSIFRLLFKKNNQ